MVPTLGLIFILSIYLRPVIKIRFDEKIDRKSYSYGKIVKRNAHKTLCFEVVLMWGTYVFSHTEKVTESSTPTRGGGGAKSFGPTIFPFCTETGNLENGNGHGKVMEHENWPKVIEFCEQS